nr:NADH dehydrogenase subunit 5 [Parantropora penelope]
MGFYPLFQCEVESSLRLLYFLTVESSIILEWELLCLGSLYFSVPLLIDKVSMIFSMTVLLIFISVMFFSVSYMSGDINLKYFIYLVSMFVLSMNLLVFFPHMAVLLLGWDGLGLTSYLLVIYYLNDKSLGAGMITAMTNRIGDALLILVVSWGFLCGHWSFMLSDFKVCFFILFSIFLACMTKSAQIPFSAWLPAAMAAPTPVSALVHSSTLVTAGIYLFIRFYFMFSSFYFFHFLAFFVGVITCLMASLSASFENDLKKVIALSTLSQLGVMMICLGLGQPMVVFFHLITHALFKALLFICAGNIIHSSQDNQDIRLMGGISFSMPVTSVVMNTANLSLCGFPFLAGFYSKDMVVENFFLSGFPFFISLLMMLSVCLTSFYTMRLSFFTLWSPFKGSSCLVVGDKSKFIVVSYILLFSGAVCGGCCCNFIVMPSVELLVLPFYLKISTLSFIVFFFVFMFLLLSKGSLLPGVHYMVSMWFLGYVTSSPMLGISFFKSFIFHYNEGTWVENFSGKGVLSVFSLFSKVGQRSFTLKTSDMFSLLSVFSLFLLLLF